MGNARGTKGQIQSMIGPYLLSGRLWAGVSDELSRMR